MPQNLLQKICFLIPLLVSGCSHHQKSTSEAHQSLLNSGCILEVKDFKQVEDIISKLKGNILVATDNNDVLTEPEAPLLKTENREALQKHIKGDLPKNLSDHDFRLVMSSVFLFGRIVLIDEYTPKFIQNLQNRENTKVMLLTNCFVGEYGLIKNYEKFMERGLNALGIDFSKNWNKEENCEFDKLPKKSSKTFKSLKKSPVFYNGMLFANAVSKGEVMKAFLEQKKLSPDVLVVIDDSQKNLLSVKEEMDKMKINCVLIKFTTKNSGT